MLPAPVIYAAVPVSILVTLGILRKLRSRNWKKCKNNSQLRGKTYLITGANSGIGLETARALVKRNARVIFACRSIESARKVINDIREQQPRGGEMIAMQVDLSSFESIENFVELVKAGFHKIDCLINNAGVVVPLAADLKTKEGFELHFGINHLGHFYLTQLLMEHLKRASPSRVVIVSSGLHEKGEINFEDLNLKKVIEDVKCGKSKKSNMIGYCNSKLMNVYFGCALAERLKDYAVDVHTCCPGFTYTNLFRHSVKWYHYFMAPIFFMFMKSSKQGAETVLHCATEYTIEGRTGRFYKNCEEAPLTHKVDMDVANKLWNVSEELIKARRPI